MCLQRKISDFQLEVTSALEKTKEQSSDNERICTFKAFGYANMKVNSEDRIYYGSASDYYKDFTVDNFESSSPFENYFRRLNTHLLCDPKKMSSVNSWCSVPNIVAKPIGFADKSNKVYRFIKEMNPTKVSRFIAMDCYIKNVGYPTLRSPEDLSVDFQKKYPLMKVVPAQTTILPIGFQNRKNEDCALNTMFRFVLSHHTLMSQVIVYYGTRTSESDDSQCEDDGTLISENPLTMATMSEMMKVSFLHHHVKNGHKEISQSCGLDDLKKVFEIMSYWSSTVLSPNDKYKDVSSLMYMFLEQLCKEFRGDPRNNIMGARLMVCNKLHQMFNNKFVECNQCTVHDISEEKVLEGKGDSWLTELKVARKIDLSTEIKKSIVYDFGFDAQKCEMTSIHLYDLITLNLKNWCQLRPGTYKCELALNPAVTFCKKTCECLSEWKCPQYTSDYLLYSIIRYSYNSKKNGGKGGLEFTSFQVTIPDDLVFFKSFNAHYKFNGAVCYEGNNPQACHFVNLIVHNGLYIKISDENRVLLSKEQFNRMLRSNAVLLSYKLVPTITREESNNLIYNYVDVTTAEDSNASHYQEMVVKVDDDHNRFKNLSQTLETLKTNAAAAAIQDKRSSSRLQERSKKRNKDSTPIASATFLHLNRKRASHNKSETPVKKKKVAMELPFFKHSWKSLAVTPEDKDKVPSPSKVDDHQQSKLSDKTDSVTSPGNKNSILESKSAHSKEGVIDISDVMDPLDLENASKTDIENASIYTVDNDNLNPSGYTLPTSHGNKSYYRNEKDNKNLMAQDCIYCSTPTKHSIGSLTFICQECEKKGDTKAYFEKLKKNHIKIHQLQETVSPYITTITCCISCLKRPQPIRRAYCHHIGNLMVCEECILKKQCKCFLCLTALGQAIIKLKKEVMKQDKSQQSFFHRVRTDLEIEVMKLAEEPNPYIMMYQNDRMGLSREHYCNSVHPVTCGRHISAVSKEFVMAYTKMLARKLVSDKAVLEFIPHFLQEGGTEFGVYILNKAEKHGLFCSERSNVHEYTAVLHYGSPPKHFACLHFEVLLTKGTSKPKNKLKMGKNAKCTKNKLKIHFYDPFRNGLFARGTALQFQNAFNKYSSLTDIFECILDDTNDFRQSSGQYNQLIFDKDAHNGMYMCYYLNNLVSKEKTYKPYSQVHKKFYEHLALSLLLDEPRYS